MILTTCAYDISDCCGSDMLLVMWTQASIWETDLCDESPGACDEMIASLKAEIGACLCAHTIDG